MGASGISPASVRLTTARAVASRLPSSSVRVTRAEAAEAAPGRLEGEGPVAEGAEGCFGRVSRGRAQHHRRHLHRRGGPRHPRGGPHRVLRRGGHHPNHPTHGSHGSRARREGGGAGDGGEGGGQVQQGAGQLQPHAQVSLQPGARLSDVQRLPANVTPGAAPPVRARGTRSHPGPAPGEARDGTDEFREAPSTPRSRRRRRRFVPRSTVGRAPHRGRDVSPQRLRP